MCEQDAGDPVTAHQDCAQTSSGTFEGSQRKRGRRRKTIDRDSKLLLMVVSIYLCPSCMKAFERACAEG